MSRSTNTKQNDGPEVQPERPSTDNVVGTVRFKDLIINRSLRTGGAPRVSFPQELPEGLQEKWGSVFAATLTPEDVEQIELAAHEVRPRFFRERFGDNAKK
ncbi:hypothetical protein [Sulfobacillus harzensis]|uniref:Uncharacterized protein n=1 Tax=Sulfobacillus harzensis TaxID=2729629 RepID=A0A7Y0L786_9FIRM|nr:hypothetical protein [Sulfobacillus harzensis]NMP24516.1 hypothetical protein [Sulfobacillus harzensis]